MKPRVPIRQALTDPALLGGSMGGETWYAWRVLLCSMMGEPLEPDELAIFEQLTGRTAGPDHRVEEALVVAGRRGGKSRAMAALGVYLAALCDWQDQLTVGEIGTLLMIAADTKQAGVLLEYADGMIHDSPMLASTVRNRTADALELRGNIALEVRSSSYRRLRGMTAIGLIGDEAAFWAGEGSANPDSEILAAVRPALATTSGPVCIISSPYGRRGEVWEIYRRHFGPEGDPAILVAQAPSRTLNPSLPKSVVDRALERDPVAARAEYLAEFRSDIEEFISLEAVEAVTAKGVIERMPVPGTTYHAFIDPSGGVRDSMTLAIAHSEKQDTTDVAVLDLIREVTPPFVPAQVCAEFAETMHRYTCSSARSDRFAAAWPEQEMKRHGIRLRPAEMDRSALYLNLLGPLNSGLVSLLDSARLRSQLVALERRTGRSGRDIVDHSARVGAHDDVANAAAGALCCAMRRPKYERTYYLASPQVREHRAPMIL